MIFVPKPREPATGPVPVSAPAPVVPPQRPVAAIDADARRAICTRCCSFPVQPCSGGSTHLVRYHRALRDGLISGADYATVLMDPDSTVFAAALATIGGAS